LIIKILFNHHNWI